MKNKYQRQNRAQKKKSIIEYRENNENNQLIYKRIIRLRILSILGIIYAILNFGLDFYFKTNSVWDFVLDGLLLIFCLIFIIKSQSILVNLVNKFLIERDKEK